MRVLDRIFSAYDQQQSDFPNYPLLKERKKILQDSHRYLSDRLFPVFETGVQLFVLGKYKLSAACFDYVGQTFVSREIFNNAAAALLLEAVEQDPKISGGYFYPVELDLDTPLNPSRQSGRAIDNALDTLKEASIRLRIALSTRPELRAGASEFRHSRSPQFQR